MVGRFVASKRDKKHDEISMSFISIPENTHLQNVQSSYSFLQDLNASGSILPN